jgi:hypothetical protein
MYCVHHGRNGSAGHGMPTGRGVANSPAAARPSFAPHDSLDSWLEKQRVRVFRLVLGRVSFIRRIQRQDQHRLSLGEFKQVPCCRKMFTQGRIFGVSIGADGEHGL